jgi:hypothetical protein
MMAFCVIGPPGYGPVLFTGAVSPMHVFFGDAPHSFPLRSGSHIQTLQNCTLKCERLTDMDAAMMPSKINRYMDASMWKFQNKLVVEV